MRLSTARPKLADSNPRIVNECPPLCKVRDVMRMVSMTSDAPGDISQRVTCASKSVQASSLCEPGKEVRCS